MKKIKFFFVMFGALTLTMSSMFAQLSNVDYSDSTVVYANIEEIDAKMSNVITTDLKSASWYIYPNWTMSFGIAFNKSFSIIPGNKVEIFIATSSGSGNLKISCNEFDFPNGDVVVTVLPSSTHTIKFTAPAGESIMTLSVTKGFNLPATVSVKYEY